MGHGRSDKPRADYSVAAYANGMRDLLSTLGIEHVTVIGHSLGGGVAMQFSYQFPHMVDRLVLVSAGGVTKDVHPLLRLMSVPVVNEVVKLLRIPGAMPLVRMAGNLAGVVHGSNLRPGTMLHDTPDLIRVLADLPDPTAYEAYLRTLRAVVDWRGQVVTMLDRCYLTENLPVQLIWGDDDSVIPVSTRTSRMRPCPTPDSKSSAARATSVPRRSDAFPADRRRFSFQHRTTRLRRGPLASHADLRGRREHHHRNVVHPHGGARRHGLGRAKRNLIRGCG
ncbi:hypothetical protein GCM10020255_076930 [Rhodococcus baikonurensis]